LGANDANVFASDFFSCCPAAKVAPLPGKLSGFVPTTENDVPALAKLANSEAAGGLLASAPTGLLLA
jgi:hypothetical protein